MQRYIEQLIEMLHQAQNNRPSPHDLVLPEEMEGLRGMIELEKSLEEDEQTMENIFGVPQIYFPPEDRLSDEQVQQLKKAIIDLWHAYHYEADFRKGEFNERQQYSKLVAKWKKGVPVLRGTNGTWHLEMFDYEQYWDEDELRYLSDEEYDAKFPMKNFDDFDDDETFYKE
ncbi:MAG: hypothetical protein LC107_09675 [Chitinophagales bacterium]|nr:hypothetical protein [Chitinophagales bacterium]